MILVGTDMAIHWYLPPLVVAISLVYSATRFETWPVILRHSVRWAVYILAFLAGTNLFLYLLSLHLDTIWYVPIFAIAIGFLLFGGRGGKRRR